MKLDLLAPEEEQLQVLVPFLEAAAKTEEEQYLELTTASFTLAARVLMDWKPFLRKGYVSTKGAFRYYQRLKENE